MFSFVGIILLVGLVKKNGIMMVDFSLTLQREKNLPAEQAIVEACLVRFRPIMMTTMAVILATLPIALWSSAGGEARQPLGYRGCWRALVLAVSDTLHNADVLREPGAVRSTAAHAGVRYVGRETAHVVCAVRTRIICRSRHRRFRVA